VNLTTHLHLVSKLRMSGSTPTVLIDYITYTGTNLTVQIKNFREHSEGSLPIRLDGGADRCRKITLQPTSNSAAQSKPDLRCSEKKIAWPPKRHSALKQHSKPMTVYPTQIAPQFHNDFIIFALRVSSPIQHLLFSISFQFSLFRPDIPILKRRPYLFSL